MSALGVLAGLVCGVLSGYGIGGGSLLLLYMTQLAGMEQAAAQGVNLIYFLPTSSAAVFTHFKNGLIDKTAALRAALPGMVSAAVCALCAAHMDSMLLRRLFGIFCVAAGVKMFFGK